MTLMSDFLQQNEINIIPDFSGKIQRLKRKGNKGKDTWIYSNKFGSFEVIVFGDWSTGEQDKWINRDENILSDKERREFSASQSLARDLAQNDKIQKQALAAQNAEQIFKMQDSEEPHPYLDKKKISKTKGTVNIKGEFVYDLCAIPIFDERGKLINAQKILLDGTKLFLSGAKVKGGSYRFTGKDPSFAFVGEGYATCWTVSQCVDGDVYCAFNLNNIEDVYKTIKDKYLKIYIIVDDDRFKGGNAGKENGHKLRSKYKNISLIIPEFKSETEGTDFNDMYLEQGFFDVKKCILKQTNDPVKSLKSHSKVDIVYDMFDTNKSGQPRATIENFNSLVKSLGVTIRYNIIKKNQEILIPGEGFTVDNRENASLAYLESWCNRIEMPIGSIGGFITYLADKNIYNPVATWVGSKKWDGVSRLQSLLNTVVAVDEDDPLRPDIKKLKESMMTKWLISAIAAAYNPNGVSAHGVLVFQGAQYLGKTNWFLNLVPKEKDLIMQSCILRPDDKDSVKQAVSNWLVELGELDATFKKSDIAMLKGFLTKISDVIRLPFAKKESHFARRTVFFGSVNPQNYLNDPTGNRRFWTISCKDINHTHNIDMQQLWAEIYENHYLKGESHHLTGKENESLNEHNKNFESLSRIEEAIQTKFNWSSVNQKFVWLTATDALDKVSIKNPSKAELNEAAALIRKLNGNQFDKSSKGRLLKIPSI